MYIHTAGFISHQINLSLALYPPLIGRARHTCSDTCPVYTPPLFCRNAQFFDIANSLVRETKKNYLFVAYSDRAVYMSVRESRTFIYLYTYYYMNNIYIGTL